MFNPYHPSNKAIAPVRSHPVMAKAISSRVYTLGGCYWVPFWDPERGVVLRKAGRRIKQSPGQLGLDLFGSMPPTPTPTPAPAPAPVKGRRAKKGGEFVAGRQYKGGQWIPKAAFEAAAAGKGYNPEPKAAKKPAQKLAVIDSTTVEPTEPTPTPVPESTPATAVTAEVSPQKRETLGDRTRRIADRLKDETNIQIKATSRILGAAAQIAENHDNLIGEVVDMVEEDLGQEPGDSPTPPPISDPDYDISPAGDRPTAPLPREPIGDRIRRIADRLKDETNIQVKATSRILGAASQIASNQDKLIGEVVDMAEEDLADGAILPPVDAKPAIAPSPEEFTPEPGLTPRGGSKADEIVHALLELDGIERMDALGITRKLMRSYPDMQRWRNSLMAHIHPDVSDHPQAADASAKLNELFNSMTGGRKPPKSAKKGGGSKAAKGKGKGQGKGKGKGKGQDGDLLPRSQLLLPPASDGDSVAEPGLTPQGIEADPSAIAMSRDEQADSPDGLVVAEMTREDTSRYRDGTNAVFVEQYRVRKLDGAERSRAFDRYSFKSPRDITYAVERSHFNRNDVDGDTGTGEWAMVDVSSDIDPETLTTKTILRNYKTDFVDPEMVNYVDGVNQEKERQRQAQQLEAKQSEDKEAQNRQEHDQWMDAHIKPLMQATKGKKGKIPITLHFKDRDTLSDEGEMKMDADATIYGDIAVHRPVEARAKTDDGVIPRNSFANMKAVRNATERELYQSQNGYIVSHAASGFRIAKFSTLQEARTAAVAMHHGVEWNNDDVSKTPESEMQKGREILESLRNKRMPAGTDLSAPPVKRPIRKETRKPDPGGPVESDRPLPEPIPELSAVPPDSFAVLKTIRRTKEDKIREKYSTPKYRGDWKKVAGDWVTNAYSDLSDTGAVYGVYVTKDDDNGRYYVSAEDHEITDIHSEGDEDHPADGFKTLSAAKEAAEKFGEIFESNTLENWAGERSGTTPEWFTEADYANEVIPPNAILEKPVKPEWSEEGVPLLERYLRKNNLRGMPDDWPSRFDTAKAKIYQAISDNLQSGKKVSVKISEDRILTMTDPAQIHLVSEEPSGEVGFKVYLDHRSFLSLKNPEIIFEMAKEVGLPARQMWDDTFLGGGMTPKLDEPVIPPKPRGEMSMDEQESLANSPDGLWLGVNEDGEPYRVIKTPREFVNSNTLDYSVQVSRGGRWLNWDHVASVGDVDRVLPDSMRDTMAKAIAPARGRVYTLGGCYWVPFWDPARGVVLHKAGRRIKQAPGQMDLFGGTG